MIRSVANHVCSIAALFACISIFCDIETIVAEASSATEVSAEVTKGRLNPKDSKPGDTVVIRLKEDVRSNGELILKKGTTITGVVRSVKRAEGRGDWKTSAQSMLELDWLSPDSSHHAVQGISFTLQSVTQFNPSRSNEAANPPDDQDLLSTTAKFATSTNNRSNVALLSMPYVVAADSETTATIEGTLGTQNSGQLFKVGHGQLISFGGTKESVDLYSHLENDTVITSPSKTFEISSGAQLHMLVGVNRN